ncbi:MAG: PID-CTERM protein-sorting domain-containing protein [Lutibacter sp.]
MFFFVASQSAYCYKNPPPPGPPPNPGLPIDGGLSYLFIAGALYGVYQLRNKKS